MSNPEIRGVPGACEPEQAPSSCTTEEQVRPPVPGCPGCRADGSGHSDPVTGYLRKGHTWNALGRAKGTHNRVTLAREETARRAFERSTVKAAQTIVRALDSPNEWVATAAAKVILETTGAMNVNAPDTEWLEYATQRELDVVTRIIARAKARMPVNDDPALDQARRDVLTYDKVLDVMPPRDKFTVAMLPAPAAIEEPAPPPPDEEEF